MLFRSVATVEAVSEFATDEPQAEFTIDEISAAAPESAAGAEPTFAEPQAPVAETHAPLALHDENAGMQPPLSEPAVAAAPGALQEFVSDLESSLGENYLPETISHEAEPAVEHATAKASEPEHEAQPELEPVGNSAPTSFGVPETEVIGEFVADLEASLGDDFLKGAPVAEAEPEAAPASQFETPVASAPAQHWPAPTAVQIGRAHV